MPTAKMSAKSTGNAKTTAATTPRKSFLKPKKLLKNCSTVSPDSSLSCISPNWEATKP